MEEKLKQLKTLLGEINDLQKAAAVLEWDQQTYMPSGGVEARAMQMATLQELAHQKFVSQKIGQLLHDLQPLAETEHPESDTACLVRIVSRKYQKAYKIPSDLVAEFVRKSALAHNIWQQARAEKNFSLFQPILKELVDLIRRKAEHLGYHDHIYDPLLDEYEPEMKTVEVSAIFQDLKTALIPLIQGIANSKNASQASVFQGDFDVQKQWDFGLDVLRHMHYDFQRGRQDKSAHPFTTSFSPNDVRITTRLSPNLFVMALFASIHEGGHALYDQGLPVGLIRTPLCEGASMAVHESQSRFWENVIGRSREFWTYFLPRLQAYYPEQLADVTLEQVYRSVNIVQPDYIRVEADEVTYNLHIFLRFELETGLMTGDIDVKDLPELWNHKMKTYLGLTPPDDALGVLQDVHWSAALFGYFPTYALGNVLSLQFYECLRRNLPDVDGSISRGELQPILQWLRQNIHAHGAKFTPAELVRKVTGQAMNPQPYITYLTTKYSELYAL
ncbi:carboxypeptidase [candidate division KSB3 bacterium]|uniref:Metal-dependent carboxypeptidase n=1 Tax=candidate division KSB3 bacterium TaxID=2044937 RepID=A0A2G6K7V5_9BACT|nr:MAG: carboxypeptidase [candidate division KSB3 bacterium]